ncbi:MAG: DNA-binding domain-containing protein [Pseudomonadota bacterium]
MPGQDTFRAALLDAAAQVPAGLQDPAGAVATRRFGVYRNNVVHSLTEAMRTGFPITQKLIGAENFGQIAGAYVRAHPPTSPLMMHYGQDFPAFLAGVTPLAHIGYLPDVARLELALRASYHAADGAPLDPARLAAVPPEALGDVRVRFAPAAVLIRSDWPLHDIWRFNAEPGAPKPQARAQDVLITRPGFDPVPHALDKKAGAWVQALMNGRPLGAAGPDDYDPSAPLALLLSQAALTDLTPNDPPNAATTTKD